MDKIFVVGSSGHASVVIDILERQQEYAIAGLVDSYVPAGTRKLGRLVVGTELELPALMEEYGAIGGIVAIGDNFLRSAIVERIRSLAPHFRFITAIHPSAQLACGVPIGAGTVVMAGAVINPNTIVGEHCIVNTRASVDHDNRLDDFSSLGPGATTGGNVHLCEFCAVSLGANVIHRRTIGPHSIVGAGATVIKDIPACVVAYGSPAVVIRSRRPGDKYL